MTLLIKDEDIPSLAPMPEVVDAIEIAFRQHADGLAPFNPRRTIQTGSVAHFGITAFRLNAGGGRQVRGTPRGEHNMNYKNRNWGVVTLFSMETGELLAIMPQFTLSGIRVGATTGVAVKHLAKEDASVAAVFGSSKVSRSDLEAAAYVRKLKMAKVFSPNPEHRKYFADEMTERLSIPVEPVDNARAAVEGSDIILCSTSSNTPVFDGNWLTPGQLITTTQSTPRPRQPLARHAKKPADVIRRGDIDPVAMVRADAICVLNEEMLLNENQREILDVIEDGRVSWDKVYDLGEALAGRAQVRKRPEDIIFYSSTGGTGIQMAAAGAVILRNARARGVGMEINAEEWFSADMSSWTSRGYFPTG
jgi:ornithine cyclodeaminase/alanine dehydrogenase-like protein (mu-crystallin family)